MDLCWFESNKGKIPIEKGKLFLWDIFWQFSQTFSDLARKTEAVCTGDWVWINILYITLSSSSSGSHANSMPNHCLKYQWDESRREKTEVNHSQQTTQELAYRDLVKYAWIFITRKDALTTNLSRATLKPGNRKLETGIWNPESGIRNLESGIQNSESGTVNRNLESRIRNPELETGKRIQNSESGIRNHESGINESKKTSSSNS